MVANSKRKNAIAPLPKPKPRVFTKNRSLKAAPFTVYCIMPHNTAATITTPNKKALIVPQVLASFDLRK